MVTTLAGDEGSGKRSGDEGEAGEEVGKTDWRKTVGSETRAAAAGADESSNELMEW